MDGAALDAAEQKVRLVKPSGKSCIFLVCLIFRLPPYCAGTSYAFRQPVAKLLLSGARASPMLSIEDAYITGAVINSCSIRLCNTARRLKNETDLTFQGNPTVPKVYNENAQLTCP